MVAVVIQYWQENKRTREIGNIFKHTNIVVAKFKKTGEVGSIDGSGTPKKNWTRQA